MHKLESYTRAKSAFESDKTFTEGQRTAGYWASFESVLQSVIMSCGRMGKRKVKIDLPCAMRLVASIRSGLQQKQLQYLASCRLFGVELAPRRLDCPDHMSLHRLTRKERNERQPTIDPFFGSSMDHHELLSARTEVRLPLVATVDHSEEAAIFAASNRATELARTAFGRLVSALLVTRPGLAQLGPLSLKGGLAEMGLGQILSRRELIPIKLQLTARDLPRLTTAYGLFAENSGDKALARALHRFVLGRQRNDLVDKLVDYVIAWEALLLTQEGHALAQELSYRFAVNASALLSTCSNLKPLDALAKFKAAYSTRSAIVHGGGDRERDKALAGGGFSNPQELCTFLEDSFRQGVFWLGSRKPADRPYRAKGGWETLLWS